MADALEFRKERDLIDALARLRAELGIEKLNRKEEAARLLSDLSAAREALARVGAIAAAWEQVPELRGLASALRGALSGATSDEERCVRCDHAVGKHGKGRDGRPACRVESCSCPGWSAPAEHKETER